MPKPSTCFNILYSRPHINKERFLTAVYILLFCYLILYSIFTTVYINNGSTPRYKQPSEYNIANVSINPVSCSFTRSGQYQRIPRFTGYFLLTFTVLIRNRPWLAAGAAASVMTYSGVAAIHMIIIFATNNILHLPEAKSRCELLPIPGASDSFFACAGVLEPDTKSAVLILSAVMLGALPMAALSTTFRKSSNKAILIFWLLLLATGHLFDNLISKDPNWHFQICPKDTIEPLPGTDFQAPLLDQSWHESFHSLVSIAQQPARSVTNSSFSENSSSVACIYSCFATTAYTGRRKQDIVVLDPILKSGSFIKSLGVDRRGGIIFWWSYTVLACLTIFTTEKRGRLPKWVHKRVFLLEHCPQFISSRWKLKTVTGALNGCTMESKADLSKAICPQAGITILSLTHIFTQLSSFVARCGFIVYQESSSGPIYTSAESSAAVGQWGSAAVVLLVVLAAVIKRIWSGGSEAHKAFVREDLEEYWRIDEDGSLGTEPREWNWRAGYAS
ncbi:MAG: hypothetical protein Q9186_000989 [Xanthomendoza sp. 1 TL-2023]